MTTTTTASDMHQLDEAAQLGRLEAAHLALGGAWALLLPRTHLRMQLLRHCVQFEDIACQQGTPAQEKGGHT
ncbi:hypothetical protein EWM64_g4528 [Hericium alpestre]|uniref:Uncharacterized protein n=1 Tax=Hericium alpestre TaxID=135208 RepID=A0A4Y9ZZA2_9AGAM|nr:hypothetical protein EWM64_g4528 [Hericium alpestre]